MWLGTVCPEIRRMRVAQSMSAKSILENAAVWLMLELLPLPCHAACGLVDDFPRPRRRLSWGFLETLLAVAEMALRKVAGSRKWKGFE